MEVGMHTYEYQMLKNHIREKIWEADRRLTHQKTLQVQEKLLILPCMIEKEKEALSKRWLEDKVNLDTRYKLMAAPDHQIQRHTI